MAAKKYRAKSIQEAIRVIKQEIGADAMILSTKRIPKNLADPYAKDLFEVEAVPADSKATGVAPAAPQVRPAEMRNSRKGEGKSTGAADRQVTFEVQEPFEVPDQFGGPFSAGPVGTGEVPAAGGGLSGIQEELVSIKEMLYLMNRGDGALGLLQARPEALGLYAKLVRLGITDRRAAEFLNAALEGDAAGCASAEGMTRAVLKAILDVVDVADPFGRTGEQAPRGRQTVAAFVGPTGVGKTTTIAKLAAELSLTQKRKVGLISVDSYRIGALEQLKTYAAIMGLPCLPAFNREDLREALGRMKGREIILIDTAGHSHLDEKRMGELGELMKGENAISSHLVLSVTASRENMKEAAENFAALSPESYVFTKMDETKARGAVIEQLMERPMPISYMTNGQRVPEDLVPAAKKDILRFILN